MLLEKLVSQLDVIPEDIQEIIALYNEIPNQDPHKYSFFKNIVTLIEMEIEKVESEKIQIRLLNNDGSGKISLDQLSKTAGYIQDAYSNGIGNIIGIQDGRNRKYRELVEESTIVASMKAGSFIISIDKIGKLSSTNSNVDLLLDKVGKKATLVEIMYAISNLDNEGSLEEYIEKFGYSSLKNIKSWFMNLSENSTPFEFEVNSKEKIEFPLIKIKNIESLISKIKIEEIEDIIEVDGKVLRIDAIKNNILIRDLKLGDLEIKLPNSTFKNENVSENIKINKRYSCTVSRQVRKYPRKTNITYNKIEK